MLPSAEVLWAPTRTAGLPPELIEAIAREDWPRTRDLVGVPTKGVYGRSILQLRARIPLGVHPVLSQHRAWAALLSGDWDDVERSLAVDLVDRDEIAGLRDILLAPVLASPAVPPAGDTPIVLASWGYAMDMAFGRLRRMNLMGWRSDPSAVQRGVPASRHARFRRLQDRFLMALHESVGGRLNVATSLALEAMQLGDEGDVLRVLAGELHEGVKAARGGPTEWPLSYPDHLAGPRGQSALEATLFLLRIAPFISLRGAGALDWLSRFTELAAIRLASPRLLLQAETWRAATRQSSLASGQTDIAALLAKARRAAPGLRCVPLLLDGIATRRADTFAESEREARRAGVLWVQVSALTWHVALDPEVNVVRDLARLLVVSGWRRPALVPPEVAADAALGMTSAGVRGVAPIELALAAGRANVTYEVARRHMEDPRTDTAAQRAAVDALAALSTTHARELLHRLARRSDAVGRAASERLSRSHPTSLSEREVEVLDLAGHGLTNKEIADRLSLSPHTVARHLANARSKLGAANRAEAVAKLGERSRR